MQVVSGRSRFNLSTLPRDDFPVIAEGRAADPLRAAGPDAARIIDNTRFAISSEETRYYLMGIFLHVADEKLKAAATDGHRLTRVTVDKPEGADGMPDVDHPPKVRRRASKAARRGRGADRDLAVADQGPPASAMRC